MFSQKGVSGLTKKQQDSITTGFTSGSLGGMRCVQQPVLWGNNCCQGTRRASLTSSAAGGKRQTTIITAITKVGEYFDPYRSSPTDKVSGHGGL